MWIAYRGLVTKGTIAGFRFADKNDVTKILTMFPVTLDKRDYMVSDSVRDNWKFHREQFLDNLFTNLTYLDEPLQENLPRLIANTVESLPVSGNEELTKVWGNILSQLGYSVTRPGCLHRRIERIKKNNPGHSLKFRCIDCDERMSALTKDTCSDCGGILDEVSQEEVKVKTKVLTLCLGSPTVNIQEKPSKGLKFSSKCRNCGKEPKFVMTY